MSKLAEAAMKKAAALKAKKANQKNGKPVSTKPAKKNGKKIERKPARERITDAKGREVTGRDNTFVCPECKGEITGPWSFKMHLVNVHEYSREDAGLRPESKSKK